MRLQILLYDQAAHGVPDYHRPGRQVGGHRAYVLDIVGERTSVERLGDRAVSVAPKANRQGTVAVVGEKAKEMLVPAPCRTPGPVDEQQRGGMRWTGRPFIYDLEHPGQPIRPRRDEKPAER